MSSKSLASIVAENKTANELASKPVGVFVGGTSGIGMNAAYAFAKYTVSPTLYIVGRSAEAGSTVVEDIKKLNAQANPIFLRHDLTLIKEADRVCQEVLQSETKINMLCLSTGYLTLGGREETPEGVDKKMAVNYYSRFRIVDKLMPLVQKAADSGEPARVVNVLAAGDEGELIEEDLGLKNNYSLRNANRHFVTMISLATERFAQLYPSVSFSHIYPGFVKTGIGRSLPIWVRVPLTPLMWIAESGQDAGEKMFYLGFTGKEFSRGPHLLNSKLGSVRDKSLKYLSPELQQKAWKHTEDVFDSALSS